jgi:hypothetical protein
MLLYEMPAFVFMKAAASFSSFKIYIEGAESVLKLFTNTVSEKWRIILKWIFKKWDGGACTGLLWLRTGICSRCL